MKKLNQKRLKELLEYNPLTGYWFWKIRSSPLVNIGDIAGTINNNGYRIITIERKLYQSSRLTFLYMEGYFPKNEVDHIDRNRSNDKWDNLRHVSRQCNSRNRGLMPSNKTGVVGVCFDSKINKWLAQIQINKKQIGIGRFEKFSDAVKARWDAEVKYGWPNCCTTSTAYQYLNMKRVKS